ncbi:caspase family protein [Massilia sp. LjRoot122]|uniref:caspase family protein n=1 Tax=Massilia sp. LjRoot122 TaxID=3342257 RepID=UPI003ECC54A7
MSSHARAEEPNGGLQAETRVALVIGNANYAKALPLKNSGNDATDMCVALKKLGFEVICKLDIATKRDFKDAIFEFTGKINQRSVALFYFAGHGLQVDGINYLLPVKADLRTKSDIEDESIQMNYLMRELEARQAALNIFFLDACRNSPFDNPIRGYVPMMGLASQLFAPRNSVIAMSTGSGQLSLDGDGRNGTFTKNLLQNIETPHQTIEDMLKTVSSGTRVDASRVRRQQDPQITMSFTQKFCMAGCTAAPLRSDDSLLASKAAELNRLQATIAETKAKQAELDSQQSLLLKKRAELDALRKGLESVESKEEELQRRQAEVVQRERELEKLNADIKASTEKFNELEAVRLSLQKKQEEVEQMRKALALQQANIDAANREIATRALKPPEKKAPPVTVVPAF